MTRHCIECKSSWPALTTVEAYNNYKRQGKIHPGRLCSDEQGEFGPDVLKGN